LSVYVTNQAGDQVKLDTGRVALIRGAMPDDPEPYCLGVVSDGYELITPYSACDMWDTRVGLPVETMAFLRRGGNLFITGKMPSFDIKGDSVDNYLILNNPMDGNGAAGGYVSNVVVVCQNTLRAAIGQATTSFKIRHHTGASAGLAKWLQRTYEGAVATVEIMKEAYSVLAETRVNDNQIFGMVDMLYKIPNKPKQDVPRKREWEEVLKAYEYRADWVKRARSTVKGLYLGGQTGYEQPCRQGTAWGAWNAVSEFETYRRGTTDSMTLNVVNGDRAHTIQRAYAKCMEFVS